MKTLLANDIVIQEDNCNLSCRYCLTGQSNFKEGHLDKLIFQPPRRSDCGSGAPLREALDRIVNTSAATLGLPVIKVTGGEIFLVRGMIEFIETLSSQFATVVVQTNGVLVTAENLATLRALGNICLQVSLDGTRYAGNSYRSETPDQHEKVYTRLDRIFSSGIPTEIYCVLNNRSLPELETTLGDLAAYGDHLTVFPFPVRGPDRDEFYPPVSQHEVLKRIWANYEKYASVLAPRAYWVRLMRFFDDGGRQFRCHLPRFAFTTFTDGNVTSCPNIWFNKLGNLLTEGDEEVVPRIGNTPFHQILLAPKPRIDACKGCFTPWDMLSMFMDREVSLDELCATPMYGAAATRRRLEEIATSYWEHVC